MAARKTLGSTETASSETEEIASMREGRKKTGRKSSRLGRPPGRKNSPSLPRQVLSQVSSAFELGYKLGMENAGVRLTDRQES